MKNAVAPGGGATPAVRGIRSMKFRPFKSKSWTGFSVITSPKVEVVGSTTPVTR
jgi:hypothetical protein